MQYIIIIIIIIITANENRLIRNIIRVIFYREECDRLKDRPVYGKMESSENEIFDETESWGK